MAAATIRPRRRYIQYTCYGSTHYGSTHNGSTHYGSTHYGSAYDGGATCASQAGAIGKAAADKYHELEKETTIAPVKYETFARPKETPIDLGRWWRQPWANPNPIPLH